MLTPVVATQVEAQVFDSIAETTTVVATDSLPGGFDEPESAGLRSDTSRQKEPISVTSVDSVSGVAADPSGIDLSGGLGLPAGAPVDTAIGFFGNALSDRSPIWTDVFSFWRIVAAIVVFLFTLAISRFLAFLLNVLSKGRRKYQLFLRKLAPVAKILVWLFSFWFIVNVVFHFPGEWLLLALIALMIGIGFASQDLLRNLFGGFVMTLDRPFQIGDKITAGRHTGEVIRIGLRVVKLMTPEGVVISVPNSEISSQPVANFNQGKLESIVEVGFVFPRKVDIASTRRILYEAAAVSSYVFVNEPIHVLIDDSHRDPNTIRLLVKAFVFDAHFEAALKSDIIENVNYAMNRRTAEIETTS